MKQDNNPIEELERYINERQSGQAGGENQIVDELFALAKESRVSPDVRRKIERGRTERLPYQYLISSRAFTRLASIAAALVIAFALVLTVPALRAQAQAIWNLFTVGETDVNPGILPTAEPPTTVPVPDPGEADLDQPPKSVWGFSAEQLAATDVVPFEVKIPAYLPEGFAYEDGVIHYSIPGVQMMYLCADRLSNFSLEMYSLDSIDLENLSRPVGASANIDVVQIGEITGEYVSGDFDVDGNWDSSLPVQTLSWVTGGVFRRLSSYQQASECTATQQDLIRIAESLE